jgi:hypothetical protein
MMLGMQRKYDKPHDSYLCAAATSTSCMCVDAVISFTFAHAEDRRAGEKKFKDILVFIRREMEHEKI